MVRRRPSIQGEAVECTEPVWTPLVDAVGNVGAGYFMLMFEVELSDGRRLYAYKHQITRQYMHLGPDGSAFVYEAPDGYRPFDLDELAERVFAGRGYPRYPAYADLEWSDEWEE